MSLQNLNQLEAAQTMPGGIPTNMQGVIVLPKIKTLSTKQIARQVYAKAIGLAAQKNVALPSSFTVKNIKKGLKTNYPYQPYPLFDEVQKLLSGT